MAAEILAILLVFAAAGAWPAPDVNETVYLTKARHRGDPAWAAGDWFLETPDAHGVFNLIVGPLVASLPLEQAAWAGRWLGWLALACGFRHAVAPLIDRSSGRVVAAALFSLAVRTTTASGEWVIGGCEAKVFAWAAVFAALGEVACGRLAWAWLPLGAATAVHPIVGGWGLVAVMLAAWWRGERIACKGTAWPAAAAVAAGALLAAWGMWPALGLSAGVDAAGRAAASRIYVVERLHHHLLPRTFGEPLVARHVLAILACVVLHRLAPPSAARSRVAAVTAAAVAISMVGCAISLVEPVASDAALSLLRFYWFRLADVLVPFLLAVSAVALVADEAACRRCLPGRPAVVRALVVGIACLDLAAHARHWPLPGRQSLLPRADAHVDAAAWADICAWVRDATPADACFLTPRGAASFTWRTGRREVVAWKNSPQDAASLIEWRRRIADCFSSNGTLAGMKLSTAALGAERMRLVSERYGADHVIVPLGVPEIDDLPFERLHANAAYAVYRLRPPTSTPRATP